MYFSSPSTNQLLIAPQLRMRSHGLFYHPCKGHHHHPLFLWFFSSLFWDCLWALGTRDDKITHLGLINSVILCPLRVSALASALDTKRLFWRGMRAALIYVYKDGYLEGSLILCQFSKIIALAVGSLLGSRTSPATGFWPGTRVPGIRSFLWNWL